jgi:hypothetical protein
MHFINMTNQLPMQKRLSRCVFSCNFINLWWGLLLLWSSMHFLFDETFLAICAIIIVRTFWSHVFNTFIIHIYLESFLLMFHKKNEQQCVTTHIQIIDVKFCKCQFYVPHSQFHVLLYSHSIYYNIWIKQTNLLWLSWQ